MTKPKDVRNLETIKQAIRELFHCVEAGPNWFTEGRSGQMAHAMMWAANAKDAITAIGAALEQAQDCINGETPEDCTPEEARQDTVEKIRKALGL